MGNPGIRATQVNNRHIGQVLGRVDGTSAIGVLQRPGVGHGALGLVIDIHGQPTNLAVQLEKLITGDQSALQGIQAVLDAHVIQGNTAKPSTQQLFVGTPDVHETGTKLSLHEIEQATAQTIGLLLGVIHQHAVLKPRAVLLIRVGRREERQIGKQRVQRQMTVECRPLHHRYHPRGKQAGKHRLESLLIHGRLVAEVVTQQVVIGKLRRGRPYIRVGTLHDQALVNTRVSIGHMLLGDRATGTTRTNGVTDVTVLLDDAFLGHHQGFGRRYQIGVMTQVGLGRRQRHEATPQGGGDAVTQQDIGPRRCGTGNVSLRRGAHAIADTHITAMMNQQFVVPLRLGIERSPGLIGLIKSHDQVAITVLNTLFEAKNEWHFHALIGSHPGNLIIRWRVGRIVGQYTVGQARILGIIVGQQALQFVCWHILERILGGLVALGIHRRVIGTLPGLYLGPGNHRSTVGMIDDYPIQHGAIVEKHTQRVATE